MRKFRTKNNIKTPVLNIFKYFLDDFEFDINLDDLDPHDQLLSWGLDVKWEIMNSPIIIIITTIIKIY